MKLKFMLVAAMAAVALMACSNDPQGGNPEGATGETAYAKIMLTQTDLVNRASGDLINPTASESDISDATLYVFGPANMLENIVPLAYDATETKWIAKFKTTTGNHKFYALVNTGALPAAVKAIIAGFGTAATPSTSLSVSVFERTILTPFTKVEELTTASNFFMTNTSTPAAISLMKGGSEATPLNNVTISVGRAVAKIALAFNVPTAANTVDESGVLSNTTFKMKALPISMYTMPVYNGGLFSTPFHSTAYAAADYMAWSNTTAPFDATSYLAMVDGAFNADRTQVSPYGYIMENSNNAAAGKAMQGKTTYAVIRGIFTPKTTLDALGANPQAGISGNDFWRIATVDGGGKPVTYEPEFYNVAPDASLVTAGKAAFKYEGGKAYYPFWIADNRYTDPVKYEIHRNNYYLATIISVSGCGSNTEDNTIIDPTNPVEEDAYVKGTLEILPWVEVEQFGGI